MALTLPTGTPLTHGYFGNGHFALMPLTHGFFWCQPGDETHMLYRDDEAGTFDDAMPCARADEGDSSVTITMQDIAPAYVDANSVLLLHFNGTDESSTVTDSSPTTKTVTVAAPAQIDDTQYKFGPTSGYFPAAGGALTITDHADFALGAAWTIEFWVNTSAVAGTYIPIWRQFLDSTHVLNIYHQTSTGFIRCLLRNNPLDSDLSSGAVVFMPGTWYHLALTFDGTTCRIFCGGVIVGSLVADFTIPDFAANPVINYGGDFRGWIDEFAIFDTCKYTANFTPPTRPWGYDQTNIYQYRTVDVSAAGSVSDPGPAVSVEVDSSGAIVGPVGNAATDLTATALSGGDVRLYWQYDFTGEPATPTGFNVYYSDDAGATYTLDGTKAHRDVMQHHYYTVESLTNGQAYTFKVVAYRTIGGVDYELSDFPTDTATADSAGPAAVENLTVTATNPD